MDFFSINNVMVNIPLGEGGYALSWIEAIGTVFGLLCIWCASREKIINYLFGLINVTLFAAIFFQIQLYASLLLVTPCEPALAPLRGYLAKELYARADHLCAQTMDEFRGADRAVTVQGQIRSRNRHVKDDRKSRR